MAEAEQSRWWFSQRPAGGGTSEEHASPAAPGRLPTLTLPQGGGAIKGIDEKLSVGQATGTASLSVPVFASPARSDFGPRLTLRYDSGAGNGPYGIGWNLAVPSITRKTATGLPRYDDAANTDVFILSGAEDLVPVLDGGVPVVSTRTVGGSSYVVTAYRPRVESGFARIERWDDTGTGQSHWRTISPGNVTSLYGQDETSRIVDSDDPTRIFTWLLDLTFDDRGNAVSYVYKAEDRAGVPNVANEANRNAGAFRYLKRVYYGNDTPYEGGALPVDWCFQLVADYGEHDALVPTPAEETNWPCRPDPFSTYRAGFEVRIYRRCNRFLMFHQLSELGDDPVLVHSTDLTYADPPADPTLPIYSLLASVTETGWLATVGGGYTTGQLPSVDFGYSALAINETQQTADALSLQNVTGANERWIDLDGEGVAGLLSEGENAWYYKRNVSPWNPSGGPPSARLEPIAVVTEKPSAGSLALTDLNGDGNLVAVRYAPPDAGWSEFDPDTGWMPFRQFDTTAAIDWASANTRFVDINGDGLADVLVTEDDVLSWYEWVADSGFVAADRTPRPFDEERGPQLVFADPTASIFLADMSGDGLTDLVRIRSAEVCYWPNLGYGRFGAKVSMDEAPVFDFTDHFDARRVRLADIDGTGSADLVYLGEQTTIWFNRSGNSWAAGHALTQAMRFDANVDVSVIDLLGTGTACIAWTSGLPGDVDRTLRYIDLTASKKPYLLTTVANNIGGLHTITYAPSTRFAVQDRAAGAPWLTRLPFCVHVVEQLVTTDAITRTSLTSQYSYHHGFYDGVEREFRGFARVDVLDADAVPAQSGSGDFTETPPETGDSFVLPPVLTRRWFHTGAFFERDDLTKQLRSEYYALDPEAPELDGPTLPTDCSAEELREACRALRGRILREEVYAQDGTTEGVHPFITREHRYQVDRLQPSTDTSYGGFYAWEREAIACHYERNPADPRIGHELSLAIDAFGNVTNKASVGYPRRAPAFPEQASIWVRYVESDFAAITTQPDAYRIGLPVETRGFQLTGVAPTGTLYDPVALGAAAPAAAEIAYEAAPDGVTAQRRLVSRQRTIYRRDDLSGPLPQGTADPLGIVDATYTLRYTAGLLTAALGAKLNPGVLANPGGFVDLDGDGNQWAPSPKVYYSADPAHPDATFAAANFYLPQGTVDPWGNASTIAYDSDNLLPTKTTDALGNAVVAKNNYRVLRPWLLTDANLNRTGVRFDAVGLVVASAVMGKLQDDGTDEGDHLDLTTPEASAADDPTTRLDYDLGAYATWASNPTRDLDHPAPVWAHTLARVRHKDPATPWIESYAYTDGIGRVALSKAQAEPGQAPVRNSLGALVRDSDGSLILSESSERWVGSGRVVYDNKGNAVKSYEPFFDSSSAYDDETDLVAWGVTSITTYDPLGRSIRVDNPNGTYRSIELDAWHSASSDENDTVLSSEWYTRRSGGALGADEVDAAAKAAAHAGTPATSDLDSLGRAFRSSVDNGAAGTYVTALALDIDGHALSTTDAMGRVALTCTYDLVGADLYDSSIDAGDRWLLVDAGGQLMQAWDSRGNAVRLEYDALRRPTNVHVATGASLERLAEQISYGEALPNAQTLNLRGAVYERRDGAGLATTNQRDFKGNILVATRRLLTDYADEVDWSAAPALDAETFTTSTTYDALNRSVTVTTPDGKVRTAVYNERSLLAATAVDGTSYLDASSYDAKGRRQSVDYGNGVTSSFSYDPETLRLTNLHTTRSSSVLQDLTYTYDPVGNVTRLGDGAQQTIFFANQVVTPSSDYTYDAIYRLVSAAGREHVGQTVIGWDDSGRVAIPLPSDGQAMRNYTQNYTYDSVGNLQQLAHVVGGGGFTRGYAYGGSTNHLTSSTIGATTETYVHDEHGNITSMPQLSLISWDWKDQLAATAAQALSEGSPPTTYYRYDAGGTRVLKATESAKGLLAARRIYLGSYEIYREYAGDGTVTLTRETLHVADVCLLETTSGAGTLTRYQFGNRLGSAVLELDDTAAIISYEEYYPFGSTSFQSGRSVAEVSLKRYRYTGKERDTESGFSYHGARYYAPWLGRWTSVDPAGFADGVNGFVYARDNPIGGSDPTGRQTQPGYDVGPFRVTNPQLTGISGLRASATLDLSGLFSGEHTFGITTADIQGTAFFSSGLELPSLHLSGGYGTYRVDLQSIRLLHGEATADLSGRAHLSTGPLTLDLDVSGYGQTHVPSQFSLGNFSQQFADMANDFRGYASVFGRASVGGLTFGAFDFSADAHGTQGTLDLKGWVGLPFPGSDRAINFGSLHGTGTFNNGQYELSGSFSAALPPVAAGFGTFSLDSTHGLRLDANYFGPQFGPLGLAPTIDPFAYLRPANMTASPGDTPDPFQRNAPNSPPTGPSRETLLFEPGTSLGYSHLSVRDSTYSIFSVGVSLPKLTLYSSDLAPLPSVLGAVPGLDSLLYGRSLSTSFGQYGFYFGASYSGSF